MKTFVYSFLWMVVVSSLMSCEKESYVSIGHTLEGQYIQAELNGEEIYLATTNGCIHGNKYYYAEYPNNPLPLDQLNLIRQSRDGKTAMHFYVSQGRLLQDDYPLIFEEGVHETYCRQVELQYYENQGTSKEVKYCGLISMIIEEWDDEDFLIGTFDGIVRAPGSKWKEIKKGAFRIKVRRENS
ncbi:MAG: hypothetical protein HRU41_06725 [Saprospiraceae bacterium]|nr:hypothetical protein [Saprospiraceae bacterium]